MVESYGIIIISAFWWGFFFGEVNTKSKMLQDEKYAEHYEQIIESIKESQDPENVKLLKKYNKEINPDQVTMF